MAHPSVIVVTGASGGVGRAVARAYGERGASVGLLARGEAGLAGAERDVWEAGGRALAVPTDVAYFDQVDAAATRVEEEFGPIDVWINAAFTSVFALFVDLTPEEYRRVTEVTYLGYVHGTMAALARMRRRDAGTIVQVGSALAYRGIPLQSAYCGAKHAIQGFHESLRCELLHERSNVHVTMVQLPAVNTPQFRWVLSRLRTVGTLVANAIAPGLLDRYLARTAYASQQTGEPRDPDQPVNLWEPADSPSGQDFGAHGPFDSRSSKHSFQMWVAHRPWLVGALGVGLATAGAAIAVRLARRR